MIATTVKNLLLVELGCALALPTIIIAATTGLFNDCNRNEFLSLTPNEATWIGILFVNFFELIENVFNFLLYRKYWLSYSTNW